MKALVGAFNQEKALVGAFSVIVQLHRLIDLRHYIFVNVYSRKYQLTMQQIYLSQNYSMWTRNSPTWDRQLYCNNFPRALSLHNLYIAVKRRAKLSERKIFLTFFYFCGKLFHFAPWAPWRAEPIIFILLCSFVGCASNCTAMNNGLTTDNLKKYILMC